ncbi:MAG: efflux transporter outer membrane subunit [Verrucomicrobiota bacterium]
MKLGKKKKTLAQSTQPIPPSDHSGIKGAVALLLVGGFLLGGCAVGPNYRRPSTDAPAEFKSANAIGAWKEAVPLDYLAKGTWWEVFGDSRLNELELQAAAANRELRAAIARVEQSRSTARLAGNELIPSLDFNPSARRERYSPNQLPSFGSITINTFRVPLDFSYEVDLWGRIRRGFEAARADAQGSFAAFHGVLLGLHADVARNYFTIRALDAEIATVNATLGLRGEQLKLTRGRFDGGIGTELDVVRAETELATAEAENAVLSRHRAEIENALAILVGENPSSFQLSPLSDHPAWALDPPVIPVGLPAHLLERRPDVAESERQLAAANARIGVAKAAFFPVVRLTGSGGYVSGDLENLLSWDSRVWSIGPGVSLPIFAQARNRSNYQRSKASYEEAVARYRQQVLVAFGDVENSLSGLRFLSEQAAAQNRAVESAQRAAALALQRYEAGLVGYLDVVDANRAALVTQRSRAQLAGERLIASVQLIKALGGGWSEAELLIPAHEKRTARSDRGAKF